MRNELTGVYGEQVNRGLTIYMDEKLNPGNNASACKTSFVVRKAASNL